MIDYSALQLLEVASSTAPATMMISSAVRSCEGGKLCGDTAFSFALDSGRTAIVVIDVAGHGAARSTLSSTLANEIASALRRDGSPAAALGRAHEVLRASDDEIPYAVAFVATVHPILRTIVYSSAGHDVAFTLADGGGTRNLAPTGPMLGIPLANHACDAVFTLGPRETLVIATDGISDSRPTGSRQFFGAVGTALAVARSLRVGSDPAQAVLEAAYAHEGGHQADDVGVVVARFGPLQRHSVSDHRYRARSIRYDDARPTKLPYLCNLGQYGEYRIKAIANGSASH